MRRFIITVLATLFFGTLGVNTLLTAINLNHTAQSRVAWKLEILGFLSVLIAIFFLIETLFPKTSVIKKLFNKAQQQKIDFTNQKDLPKKK